MKPFPFKNILIVRTDRIGDVILTLPVAAALHASMPGTRIAMMVREYTSDLVSGQAGVTRVLVYDAADALKPFWSMVRELRSARFDAAVIAYPRFRIALMLLLAGIPVRIGTSYRWYSFLFNKRVRLHRRGGTKNEAEYNLALLEPLGCPIPDELHARITPGEAHRAVAEALRKELGIGSRERMVVLHPGSGGSAREWPADHFGLLARALSRSATVLVMGSEAERSLVDRVASIGGQNVRGITGRLALMEYAAFIRMARLFVANSTGPLHVAAAVGTPVIGFYPSDRVMGPGRWGPLTPAKTIFVPQEEGCARCASGSCDAHGDMARIAVETVAAAAQRMLGSDGSERTKRRPRGSSRRARVRR